MNKELYDKMFEAIDYLLKESIKSLEYEALPPEQKPIVVKPRLNRESAEFVVDSVCLVHGLVSGEKIKELYGKGNT
jgi:hypothetical protein